MAKLYFGVDVGGSMPGDVTVAAATTNKAFEFVVDVTGAGAALNKMQALRAIEAIENKIALDNIDFPA